MTTQASQQTKLSVFGLGTLMLGCLAVGTSLAQGELSFTRQDFGVGAAPQSVAVGDFNDDGQQDLATANGNDSSVSILLGEADGTFEPAQDSAAGAFPSSVTVGDFNDDGRQDLATVHFVSDSVSILLGRGDGTFEPPQDLGAGAGAVSITVGDFNSDGRQDLATANNDANTVSILLGNGDGTFEPAQEFGLGGVPLSVTVGDFNGDGRQDLATANVLDAPLPGSVSILLGNGDGTFEPAQDFAAGGQAASVTVGDFNNDGRQDLATANNNTDSVSILLGNGDGTFEPAQDFGVGGQATSVTVGDFNNDARQDLATSVGFSSVSVLLGRGEGTFEPAQDFGVGLAPISIAVGDFNGDGQQDLATANEVGTSVSILINNTADEIAVKIDIKPSSFPNSINPRSKGVIPVAVLTTATFDASTVDPTTVFFGANGTEAAPVHSALEDVDGDGNTDLILHFRTQAAGIACGDTSASLAGGTFGGQPIEGADSIRTVGCK